MQIWQIAPGEDGLQTTLRKWRLIEATYADSQNPRTRHFVGRNVAHWSGRVSSAVIELDIAAKRGRTQSGRVYQLEGAPGIDAEALAVCELWACVNAVAAWRDITDELFAEARKSGRPADNGSGPLQ